MTKPFTKWSKVVEDVHDLPSIVDKAWDISTSGKPGCVHIDLPKCILTSIYKNKQDIKYIPYVKQNIKNNINFYELSYLINKAKKPVIIIGKGCNKYSYKLCQFARKSNIPVTSTIHGVGIFPEDSILSLKMLGMHGSPVANYVVNDADLIINVGSRFDDRITGNIEKYAPEAYNAFKENRGGIIHVNIEESEFNKNIDSHYNFNMDCGVFLDNITPYVSYNKRYFWFNKIHEWKKKHSFRYIKPPFNKLNTQMVIEMINNYLPYCQKWKITTGVGNHQMIGTPL